MFPAITQNRNGDTMVNCNQFAEQVFGATATGTIFCLVYALIKEGQRESGPANLSTFMPAITLGAAAVLSYTTAHVLNRMGRAYRQAIARE